MTLRSRVAVLTVILSAQVGGGCGGEADVVSVEDAENAVAEGVEDASTQDAGDGSARPVGGECAVCHLRLAEVRLSEPAAAWQSDVHGAAGLTCTGCHGGDALASTESVAHAGMRAEPEREAIPAMCGRCHSNGEFMRQYDPTIRIDQVDAYFTSRHGERLRRGDPRVAVCNDCHTAHSIQAPDRADAPTHPANIPDLCGSCHADAERMAPYEIPTDQLDDYRSSVHWAALTDRGDLSAAVCNDCHGNHGAVPPGHRSVGRVCAECHFQIGEYFFSSPHDSVFVGLDRPGCATCHGNHRIEPADDELLGLGDRGTCADAGCHTDTDAGGIAALAMLSMVDSLLAAHVRSDSILDAAEQAGMPVDQPRFELAQVQNAVVGARAVMHTARLDSVRIRIEQGLAVAGTGFEAGVSAFKELRTRRTGLAVSSLVILLVVAGLVIKIRELGTE